MNLQDFKNKLLNSLHHSNHILVCIGARLNNIKKIIDDPKVLGEIEMLREYRTKCQSTNNKLWDDFVEFQKELEKESENSMKLEEFLALIDEYGKLVRVSHEKNQIFASLNSKIDRLLITDDNQFKQSIQRDIQKLMVIKKGEEEAFWKMYRPINGEIIKRKQN